MYHKIYNGLSAPYEVILLKGHLDENEVREALEDELGDKDHVERLMRREPSTHFRLMGLECKVIDGEVYEYYIAFCGN